MIGRPGPGSPQRAPLHGQAAVAVALLAAGLGACAREAPPAPAADPAALAEETTTAERSAEGEARVRWPALADGPLELRWGGVVARISLRSARPVRGRFDGERRVYEGVLGEGTRLLGRTTAGSAEDHVHLPAKPAEEALQYELDMTHVAGLRRAHPDAPLELLDRAGVPRWRVHPPLVFHGAQEAHTTPAALRVQGCAVDTSSRPPWGRAPTPPGATRCVLEVSWHDRGVTYPALVDPLWTTTQQMSTARSGHAAVALPDGRAMVAGGYGASSPLAATELFDAASGTWADVQALKLARYNAAMALLPDGRALLVGGDTTGAETASAEVWDPATGAWTPASPMAQSRSLHTATSLLDGRVLVAGGSNTPTLGALITAEAYDPQGDQWSSVGSFLGKRFDHTATRLADGKVLLTGGAAQLPGPVFAGSWLFDPATNLWVKTGDLVQGRLRHAATRLGEHVLVAGGMGTVQGFSGQPMPTTELYDPASGTWKLGPPIPKRFWTTLWAVGTDRAVMAGGFDGQASVADVQVLDLSAPQPAWLTLSPLTTARRQLPAIELSDGSVLLAGGREALALASAERFRLLANGAPCPLGAECQSRHCVDGVCCDTPCQDGAACWGCVEAKTGKATGVCGAVTAGSPEPKCAKDTPASCGFDGSCDGSGACRKYGSSTLCQPTTCEGGQHLLVRACNGAGACPEVTAACPMNAACDLASGACTQAPCAQDSDCIKEAFCDEAGACLLRREAGEPCAGPVHSTQCTSGYCVDGVCCNALCDDACAYCDGPDRGTCAPRPAGAPPRAPRAPCPGQAPCEGRCDGDSLVCTFPGPAVTCGERGCRGTQTSQATLRRCTSDGSCGPEETVSCGGAVCVAGDCQRPCTSDEGCLGTFRCDTATGECVARNDTVCDDDGHTSVAADGVATDCAPFRCVDTRTCREFCRDAGDCVDGHRCTSAGRCVREPVATSLGPDCACRAAGAASKPAPLALLALAAMALLGRGRRQRVTSPRPRR